MVRIGKIIFHSSKYRYLVTLLLSFYPAHHNILLFFSQPSLWISVPLWTSVSNIRLIPAKLRWFVPVNIYLALGRHDDVQ